MSRTTNSRGEGIHGDLVRRGSFGDMSVEIYEDGYVRVGAFLTRRSPFEALRSIDYTQLPEGGGVLTIATDRKVHTITADRGVQRQIARGQSLETAGRAVMIRRPTA